MPTEDTRSNTNHLIITIIIAFVFAAVGFFAGTKFEQSHLASSRSQFTGQFGNRGNGTSLPSGAPSRTNGFRGGQIIGNIISLDDKSITVKLDDGSSRIILFSNSTSISQAQSATIADLKVGDKIAAFGSTNTDGSVSVQNIQINPITPQNREITPTPTQ